MTPKIKDFMSFKMASFDLISAVVFYMIVFLLIFIYRKRFSIESKVIFLYRTKFGIDLILRTVKKHPRFFRVLGFIAIPVGFMGMAYISYILLKGAYSVLFTSAADIVLSPVVPGVKIPRSPFFIPFWSGMISIFIIVLVHEFGHGIIAALQKIKIKSTGFGLFLIFPIAFVEPDEKEVKKRKASEQLSMFAIGPFINILFGIMAIGLFLLLAPVAGSILEPSGVNLESIDKDKPAFKAGIDKGEKIIAVNDVGIETVENFTVALNNTKPGSEILLKTDKGEYELITDVNPATNMSLVGVRVSQALDVKGNVAARFGNVLPSMLLSFVRFLTVFFALSLGIGLANLLPIGPIDGGRMLFTGIRRFFAEERAFRIWKNISILFVLLVLINLIFPYFKPA